MNFDFRLTLMLCRWHSVGMEFIRTQAYLRAMKKADVSERDERRLLEELAAFPRKSVVVPGGGGIRKIRLALGNRGKSAGARVIYFYLEIRGRIYLLTVYAKNVRVNLSESEKEMLKKAVSALKKENEK